MLVFFKPCTVYFLVQLIAVFKHWEKIQPRVALTLFPLGSSHWAQLKGDDGLSGWVGLKSWHGRAPPGLCPSCLPPLGLNISSMHWNRPQPRRRASCRWSCCSRSAMCQASEPPLSPIPTNKGIHGVGFLPWLFFTRCEKALILLLPVPQRDCFCVWFPSLLWQHLVRKLRSLKVTRDTLKAWHSTLQDPGLLW